MNFKISLYILINNKPHMNSDSCQEQQRDVYHLNTSLPKPLQNNFNIYLNTSHKKPDLALLCQPIPTQLFFPYSQAIQNDSILYCNQKNIVKSHDKQIIYLCIHGAGQSALVFGHLAKQMKHNAYVFSYDMACHGYSPIDFCPSELKMQKIIQEALKILEFIQKQYRFQQVVLVGHSLGGSIVTRIASFLQNSQQLKSKITINGVIMIDTIQGVIKNSKIEMMNFIKQRPQSFESIESAIKWNYKAGCVKRLECARYSIPSFLKKLPNNRYGWRTQMMKTCELWDQWFDGISKMFVNLKTKKLLFTTTKFRLDQTLLQGLENNAFDIQIFGYSGHNIQEDEYEKVSRILLATFN